MEIQAFVAVVLCFGLWASRVVTDTSSKRGSRTNSEHGVSVYPLAGSMKDIYFFSKTRTLKVVRQRLDILEECHTWNITDIEDMIWSEKVYVTETKMDQMTALCIRSTVQNQGKGNRIIYPGTVWCGNGNDADSYDDLGDLVEEDKCCRAHDTCQPSIGPFETLFGLYNFAIWSKMHCRCDKDFYHCLKTVDSNHSAIIGQLFYNILDIGCFAKIHPEKCVRYSEDGSCLRYKPDKSQPRTWQFVDNQFDY